MKVVLYLATTANGLIAGENDNVDWVWENKLKVDAKILGQAKHFVVGRKTYDLMPKKEFQKKMTYYVFTANKNLKPKVNQVHFVHESPKTFLSRLKKNGAEIVCIYGGANLNASFMEANQVDELILDIEPITLGKGINLFRGNNFDRKLKLLHLTELPGGTIRIHYQVKK
jgi:dihydrofolate reductase